MYTCVYHGMSFYVHTAVIFIRFYLIKTHYINTWGKKKDNMSQLPFPEQQSFMKSTQNN